MGVLDLNRGTVLGQPKVLDGFITLNVECSCKTVTLLVGTPGSIKCCSNKDCEWAFMIGPTTRMDESGMHWTIAWQRLPKDPLTGLPMMPQL